MSLKGKVALVTGATSGIGLETASALAGLGATVILGVRNTKAAEDVVKQIQKDHPGAKVVIGPPLDLISQESVQKFAEYINKEYPQLHILINNAGVSFMSKTFTPEGVGGIAQTNHLGPYTLTRLLEKKLVASKARVVTVASVTHRTIIMKNARSFLTDWRSGYYQHSKLANVLFAYELQRRLGNHGVTSCAADPGGVKSNIWDKSPMFSKGIYKTIIDLCYSPPADGAKSVVYAATVPWEKNRRVVNGTPVLPADDLRYYSRGLFCSPLLCKLDGYRGKGFRAGQNFKGLIWGLSTVVTSLWDWPLRKLSGNRLANRCKPVRSATQTYDAKLAAELWEVSAELAKLPPQPQV
ncbi:hypothetical protein VOLCADRAFT_104328 [Volvox carteri f. nagariensis]|uniref:Uncharacterized protein n=1 Tax=Volvox carteri f. nagariensis TaxID=3068 RepID=D8TSY1_VOLCA|nr:uncharacterized protein VOLCADRAFT_104328 [Volvox carteri f. nagariensis]EFJ49458.1 hypothetical protein VOLCADRAFT_104328 [Volvox carteri f. nagariensis]|eukprot:XP_002949439.1 hypothetical protein VOLCADRAFT_104328 [Volvox carteri f. nagariensis]